MIRLTIYIYNVIYLYIYIYISQCDLFLRCNAADAGEYKVVAKSSLGEATTYATLVVNGE